MEKRRAERVPVHIRVLYRSETLTFEGWAKNLSRNGLFMRSDFLDHEGVKAEIEVRVPGSEEILSLAGRVVRVDTSPTTAGMAIRFTKLTTPVRRALANLVIERSCMATA